MAKSTFTVEYYSFRLLLIEYRERKNLSQSELAKRLSRPQSYVSKYESGERRIDVIEFRKIASVLEIDLSKFWSDLESAIVTNKRLFPQKTTMD